MATQVKRVPFLPSETTRFCANRRDPPPFVNTSRALLLLSATLTNTRGEALPIHHFWGRWIFYLQLLVTYFYTTQIHFGDFPLNYTCVIQSESYQPCHCLWVPQSWACQGSGEVNQRCRCEHHLQVYRNFYIKKNPNIYLTWMKSI